MSFLSGTSALTICRLSNPLPEDHLARLAANAIGEHGDVKDEPLFGWAGWRHSEAPIDEAEAICGGHLYIQFVKAERKLPSSTLNDEMSRRELACLKETGSRMPSKERRSIKAELKKQLTLECPVVAGGVELIVDRKWKLAYVGTASPRRLDDVIALFHKSCGVELIPFAIASEIPEKSRDNIKGVSIRFAKYEDNVTGRDFLTWLWWHAETKAGKVAVDADKSFEGFIEPITFAAEEAKGALLATIRKGGCPSMASEAKAALLSGKKLKKAVLTIARDKQIWRGTFDADTLALTGLRLPEGEEMEQGARLEEQSLFLYMLQAALTGYLLLFAEDFGKDDTPKKIKKWAEDRESL